MHESPAEVTALQQLLDASYERAGAHLLRIHTPERRATAEQLVERLTGMCLLVLATVTADCRPIAGPVDGVFYRARSTSARAPTRCASATSAPGRRSVRRTSPGRISR